MKVKAQDPLIPIRNFFKNRGWTPFAFQEQAWEACVRGESGLIHVPTGSGKTYAAVMGVFAKIMAAPKTKSLKALYITPLRALARDIELALQEPIEQEGWPVKVESRTGDTKGTVKKKQLQNPADFLLTTPESLSVLISQTEAEEILKSVQVVILDEWHELMSSKRGSLLELSLSYLRHLNPELQVWALSASIGNIEQAAQVAVGPNVKPVIISGGSDRNLEIDVLLPASIDGFPWAGHLGFALRDALIQTLDREKSTLIFTNTRSQAERWFETLSERVPEMKDVLAIHHSSLSREDREMVEEGIKNGDLKWVVCTSSLDLGVDFQPVEQVVQIGSPKMVARLLQRAGRSAHRPGGVSELLFVPTNSWEILEIEAVKKALKEKQIEPRFPLGKPIDVLLQHMTTLACGPGFRYDELKAALKETFSFSAITPDELNWCLRFLTQGGDSLKSYEQFHKITYEPETGLYRLSNRRLATMHRMSIGTIVSRESIQVVYTNRKKLGSVEEDFIARMKRGDVFQFAGKKLELVMIKDMQAYVRSTGRPTSTIPSWLGGRLPLSETLSEALREVLSQGRTENAKVNQLIQPLLEIQARRSELPGENEFLVETWSSKEGEHLFAYPFEGRMVHEGLAQVWAHRFAKREPSSFSFSINEYGFEIMAPVGYAFRQLFDDDFFSTDHIEDEMSQSLEFSGLSQRHFREIATISGLVFVGYPGAPKTGRQKHISASLLFDVFKRYEPGNLLLQQSYSEVLKGSLESDRLRRTLGRLSQMKTVWKTLSYPSPLAFPLFLAMNAGHLSNESIEKKVERLKKTWEKMNEHPLGN